MPESITSIPVRAFYRCDKLSTIDLSHCTVMGGGAFAMCTSLAHIDLSSVTLLESVKGGYYSNGDCEYYSPNDVIGSFTDSKNLTSVSLSCCKKIGDRAFKGCTSLDKIVLP